MTDVDLSSYKALYIQTARKYVTDMKTAESTLTSDKTNKEAIESMHISSHSLKSQSQIMGYVQTGTLCGVLEVIFRNIHNGTNTLTDAHISPLHEAILQIASSLDSIEGSGKEIDLETITQTLKSFVPNSQ